MCVYPCTQQKNGYIAAGFINICQVATVNCSNYLFALIFKTLQQDTITGAMGLYKYGSIYCTEKLKTQNCLEAVNERVKGNHTNCMHIITRTFRKYKSSLVVLAPQKFRVQTAETAINLNQSRRGVTEQAAIKSILIIGGATSTVLPLPPHDRRK